MHEAKKSGLSAETQPHSVGHNTELTCNVAQAAPSVINTTYHSLKSGHTLTTPCPGDAAAAAVPIPRRCEPDLEDRTTRTPSRRVPASYHTMSTSVLVLWWAGRGGDDGGTYYVG